MKEAGASQLGDPTLAPLAAEGHTAPSLTVPGWAAPGRAPVNRFAQARMAAVLLVVWKLIAGGRAAMQWVRPVILAVVTRG